jgi:multidrug transporter EmrE-like cation transporter
MKTFFLALISILLSVGAQFALKAGMVGRAVGEPDGGALPIKLLAALSTQPAILFGFALYGLGALVWLLVLAQWDVSKAYPLVGAGFILTTIVGYCMGEQLSTVRVAGVLLICVGVVLVGRS